MPSILSIRDLQKAYGVTQAVAGVSFELGRREILGLLGPNGAGKTTTINMVLGVLRPDSGSIRIEGQDLATYRSQVLELILACWFFKRVFAHVVRTGLIARYSAETVS